MPGMTVWPGKEHARVGRDLGRATRANPANPATLDQDGLIIAWRRSGAVDHFDVGQRNDGGVDGDEISRPLR